jgi:hypothetical protein
MKYFIDGKLIRFENENCSGLMSLDHVGAEMTEYEAWLAEGNTPELWEPEETE